MPFGVNVNLNLWKPTSRSQHHKVPWDGGVNRKERVWRPQSKRGIRGKFLFPTSFKACYSGKAKKLFDSRTKNYEEWRVSAKCKAGKFVKEEIPRETARTGHRTPLPCYRRNPKKRGNSVTDITKDMTDTIVLLGGLARVTAKKTNLPLFAKTLFLDYR